MAEVAEPQNRQPRTIPPPQARGPPPHIRRPGMPIDREKVLVKFLFFLGICNVLL